MKYISSYNFLFNANEQGLPEDKKFSPINPITEATPVGNTKIRGYSIYINYGLRLIYQLNKDTVYTLKFLKKSLTGGYSIITNVLK